MSADLGNSAELGGAPAISASELKSRIDKQEKFILVDVREPEEHEFVKIPDSVLMPKEEFFNGMALEKLPKDVPVILYCRSGVRSADCLAVLKDAGFVDATHVAGGVLAWGKDIDPSLPIY